MAQIPHNRQALTQLLARVFPHSQQVDQATLDAFVDGLLQAEASITAGLDAFAPAPADPSHDHRYFTLRATHARRTPVAAVFTGSTHAVRVRLPDDEPKPILTRLGAVLPRDHLLPTVAALRERFGDRLTGPCARVDLITAARSPSNRFSPMSLYFGYPEVDADVPDFMIYEPGDALGKPGALYFAATLDTIVDERAGYKPTSLSSPDHWYTGGVRMDAHGRDPKTLYMRAAVERGGEPHFRLYVEYEALDAVPSASPIRDLIEAATRMLAVEQGVGFDHNLIERLVAETGILTLPWIERPDGVTERPSPPLQEDCFEPSRAFDPFLATLAEDERAGFEASVALLLGAVARADGKFDDLERIEIDWVMNFEVPSVLGDCFRFSAAALREYQAVLDGSAPIDGPAFAVRLDALAAIVRRLPADLRARYSDFVIKACGATAKASGGWLWFGNKVSAREKRVLDRIAAALALPDHRPSA